MFDSAAADKRVVFISDGEISLRDQSETETAIRQFENMVDQIAEQGIKIDMFAMERKYCFPNAFVLDYKEEFGDVEGTGTFTLVLRQKKDKIASVAVEGNYSA